MSAGIRRAVPGDLAHLMPLAEAYCDADGHDFDAATVRRGLVPLLADDLHGVVLVADDGRPGGLAGYGVVTWSWSVEIGGPEAVLDEIYVREQGRGTGSTLIEALVETCRTHGMRRVFLETERPNHAARRLYARHGFTADDSVWMSRLLEPARELR
jgi:GNAT superfamily N-acetyltransferase